MARKNAREQKPAKSNRGRPDARGIFIVFDVEDEPLTREVSGDSEGAVTAGGQCEMDVDEAVREELGGEVPGR